MASKIFMITMPRRNNNGLNLLRYINSHDVHKWIIALEKGRNGYEHWQCRLKTSEDFFEIKQIKAYSEIGKMQPRTVSIKTGWLAENIPEAHCEEANDEWEYETKGGIYFTWRDKPKNLSQRFGAYRLTQKTVLDMLERTNDRQVVVWYNASGKVGKSWLTGALWERRLAYKTSGATAIAITNDIANSYYYGEYRPYVVIDLPRTARWTDDLYLAIEQIKDGLIGDPRYGAHMVNIDVKVLIMTNSMPNLKKLSADRWIIIEDDGTPQYKIAGSFT